MAEPRAGEPAETPLRRRTRRAIVDAAVKVWALDWSASLSAVAEEAGVSRSTLHRYFVDRAALVDGCLRTAWEVLGSTETCDDEQPGATSEGLVLDQLAGQLNHVLGQGEWVLFLWTDPTRFEGHELSEALVDGEDQATRDLIRRGQAAGEIDPAAPVEWVLGIYYSVLYCAAELTVRGTVSAHEASRLAVRALGHGISAG